MRLARVFGHCFKDRAVRVAVHGCLAVSDTDAWMCCTFCNRCRTVPLYLHSSLALAGILATNLSAIVAPATFLWTKPPHELHAAGFVLRDRKDRHQAGEGRGYDSMPHKNVPRIDALGSLLEILTDSAQISSSTKVCKTRVKRL